MIEIYSCHCLFDPSLFAIQKNDDSRVFKERSEKFHSAKIWYYFDSIRNVLFFMFEICLEKINA